jgi:hypothetical protein
VSTENELGIFRIRTPTMKFTDQESRQQRVEAGVNFVDKEYLAVFPHLKPRTRAAEQHLGAGGFVAKVHADLFVSFARVRKCDSQNSAEWWTS